MKNLAQKKTGQQATSAPAAPVATVQKDPALVAFYVVPAPADKPPVLLPIGTAMAHEDGQGFTLDLNLMPTTGGRIILRAPKAKQAG